MAKSERCKMCELRPTLEWAAFRTNLLPFKPPPPIIETHIQLIINLVTYFHHMYILSTVALQRHTEDANQCIGLLQELS